MGRKVDWSKLDRMCGNTWTDANRKCSAPLHWCSRKGNHDCVCSSCGIKIKK